MTENATTGVGIASRKAHPIFSRTKSSDVTPDSGPVNDFCNLFVCQANWNNSDPRLRPPICCVIVGVVVIAAGIFALMYEDFPEEVQITGAVVTTIGGAILLFSFGWIYVTRRAILKSLALKARPRERICPKHGIIDDCVSNGIVSPDPIMTRGLVSIKYRSCDDTIPRGCRNELAATKSVHAPQRDSYLSVESTCFQLIASPSDLKRGREGCSDGAKSSNQKTPKHRLFDERYFDENKLLPHTGKLLSQCNSTNVNNNNPAKQLLQPELTTTQLKQTEESLRDILPRRYLPEKNTYTQNQYLKEVRGGDIYDCENHGKIHRNGEGFQYNSQRKYRPGRY